MSGMRRRPTAIAMKKRIVARSTIVAPLADCR
jgi:hypothetical protein